MGAREVIDWNLATGGDAVQQVSPRRLGPPGRRPGQAEARLEFAEQADEASGLQTSRCFDNILKFRGAREELGIAAGFIQRPVEGESSRRVIPLDRLDPSRPDVEAMRHLGSSFRGRPGTSPAFSDIKYVDVATIQQLATGRKPFACVTYRGN